MTATAPTPSTARVRATALLPRLSLVLAALLAAFFATATPAAAHAALTASDPADGEVVATAPAQVSLSFSEGVAMNGDSIRVLDPRGTRVDTGELRNLCSGNTIRYGTALRPGLPDGTYTVAWQAISADSHPVSGAFTFSVGSPSETAVTLPSRAAGDGPVAIAYGIARYVAYAGFAVLVGAAAFILLCWRRGAAERSMQRLVVRAWVALTVATLAMLMLRNPYTGSGNFADAFDLAGLKSVLETKSGASLVSRLLLLGAAALFITVLFGSYARRHRSAEASEASAASGSSDTSGSSDASDASDSADAKEESDLVFGLGIGGTVVAAGIAATWALSEHASTGIQPAIAMPADILHLLAVATWLGGLTALLVALHKVPGIERGAIRRFSTVAFTSVLVLAATGTYQSWRQVGSWSALTGTDYGRLLLVKIGLVGIVVAIAYVSRKWTSRLGAGPDAKAAEGEEDSDVSRETSDVSAASATTTAVAGSGAEAADPGARRSSPARVPPGATRGRSRRATRTRTARACAGPYSPRRVSPWSCWPSPPSSPAPSPDAPRSWRPVAAPTPPPFPIARSRSRCPSTPAARTARA